MSTIYLPNYNNGSIVNLMSSIMKAFGGRSEYKPLSIIDPLSLSGKNVLLILIDGLGYEFIKKHGFNSHMHKNLAGKMTSVFPPTTASALTSFYTGLAPQQHALTGWFMYLKEAGLVSKILPFISRAGNLRLSDGKIKFNDVFNAKSVFDKINAASISIKPGKYCGSEYSLAVDGKAKALSYTNLDGMFRQINRAVRSTKKRKYIFSYWEEFDTICHKKGSDSKEAITHFMRLDKKIHQLSASLRDENTVIIVTGDHGLVNTRKRKKKINLNDHARFTGTLSVPLSGDRRAVYCYVKPGKIKDFENYIRKEFRNVCYCYKSKDIIKNGYYGLFKPNDKLEDRIGDYVLILKDDYVMIDQVVGENRTFNIGNHGGVSKEEMFVPLIMI